MSDGYNHCFDDYRETVGVLSRFSIGKATLAQRAQDYREPDSLGPVLIEAADEIDRLQAERDEARAIAINLYRFLSYHEVTPEIDESYGWLREAAEKWRTT